MPDTPNAEKLIKRQEKLNSAKLPWESLWDQLAEFAMPRRLEQHSKAGKLKGREILDTTAKEATQEFAAGYYSHLSHPLQQWWTLVPAEPALKEDHEVMNWCHSFTEFVHGLLRRSNFYEKLHPVYIDHGWAGTGCIYSEYKVGEGYRFQSFAPYDYTFELNSDGQADTVFVTVKYTPRQAAQKFGEDNLPERTRQKLEDGARMDEKETYIHCVYPREYGKPADEARNNLEMPYASVWVHKEYKEVVEEKGYRHLPYHISRYSVANGEDWGTSPARIAYELIAYTNSQRRSMARASQRAAEPPWLAPSDGSVGNISNKPNAIIYWQPDPAGIGKPEQLVYQGRIEYTLQDYQQDVASINRIFNVDLFRALDNAQQNDRKTATEVRQIVAEDKSMLAPFLGRLKKEMFDTMMNRIVDLAFNNNLFPEEPPEKLEGADTEIEYGGELFLALQAQDVNAITQTLNRILPLAEISPEVLDPYDLQQASVMIARKNGMPSAVIEKKEDMKQKAEQRKQMQMQQMEAQQAEQIADAYEKGAKKPEPGSASERLTQGGQE